MIRDTSSAQGLTALTPGVPRTLETVSLCLLRPFITVFRSMEQIGDSE